MLQMGDKLKKQNKKSRKFLGVGLSRGVRTALLCWALTLLKGWLRSGHCEADDLNHDPSWPVDGDVVILEEITLMSTEVLFCNNIIIVINFVLVGL